MIRLQSHGEVTFTITRFRDGDTVEGFATCERCMSSRKLVIRIINIESWELDSHEHARARACAREATELLRGLSGVLLGNIKKRDKYGRTVGDVLLDGNTLSTLMVTRGWAWPI